MTIPIITSELLKQKILEIESQVDETSKRIVALREQKEHLSYLLNNFQSLFGSQSNHQSIEQTLFPEIIYDSSKGTKQLLTDILRKESRSMNWKEISEIFIKIKPDIKISTIRVGLSQMNSNPNYHVKLIREGAEFKYLFEK